METNDFGFTFEEDVKAVAVQDVATAVESHADIMIRFQQYDQKVTLFLRNLCADPDKPMINWPNRVTKISNFIKELEQIRNSK